MEIAIIKNWIDDIAAAKEQLRVVEDRYSSDDLIAEFNYEDKLILNALKKEASEKESYSVSNKILKALKQLKIEAHPEILEAKYYKKYLDQLTVPLTNQQLKIIDDSLRNSYHPRNIRCHLSSFLNYEREIKVLKELHQMGVISAFYEMDFPCDCGESVFVKNVKHGDSIYKTYGVEEGNDKNLMENINNRYWECDECGTENCVYDKAELEFIKDDYSNLLPNYFKVEVAPDLTLDKL